MAEINYKPNLCPNQEVNLDELQYPLLASMKLDGIRCIIHPDLGIISRSLKQIPNKQLQEKFAHVLTHCKNKGIILDGEIYSHKRTFQEIQRAVMTKDFSDGKTIRVLAKEFELDVSNKVDEVTRHINIEQIEAYTKLLIADMEIYAFDCLRPVPSDETKMFSERQLRLRNVVNQISSNIRHCTQVTVKNSEEVKTVFKVGLDNGYEGLILKNPKSQYKFGRSTVKENNCFKVKPFIEKSTIIKDIVQSTAIKEGVERTVNELGYSQTSNKKDDRELIDKASAFLVDWNGRDLKLTIKATDVEKEDIWKNREKYIGCEVLFKAMDVGVKDLPRHPVALRWWLKDE